MAALTLPKISETLPSSYPGPQPRTRAKSFPVPSGKMATENLLCSPRRSIACRTQETVPSPPHTNTRTFSRAKNALNLHRREVGGRRAVRRRDAGKVASSLPFLWPSISDVVHLNGVQETLEVLNQGGSPISPALRVGEDQQGPNWHLAQILVQDCVEVESICGGWTQERGGYSEMKGVVVGLVE